MLILEKLLQPFCCRFTDFWLCLQKMLWSGSDSCFTPAGLREVCGFRGGFAATGFKVDGPEGLVPNPSRC